MSDVIARARAALEGVTEAPWEVRDAFIYPLSIRCGLGGIWERDARFIAAARSLLPELVAELETTRAQRDQALAESESSDSAEADSHPSPPEPRVCRGFAWVGQSFASCNNCGQPYWEHEYDERIKAGTGPFGDEYEYAPITEEEKAAVRSKWEGRK